MPDTPVPGRLVLLGLVLALVSAGCRAEQDMANQPRYDTYETSDFFADGRSARPVVPGTVARGQLRDDTLLYTGRLQRQDQDFANEFPFEITEEVLRHGRERFTIYCALCHGAQGRADGKIVERGFLKPTNFHGEHSRGYEKDGQKVLLRDVPVGYLFDVITNGFGGMADYRAELKPRERWAVVAYIKALQASQGGQP